MPNQPASQPDSMLGGLQKILGMLGTLMATPDADADFLSQLQQVIVQAIKQGTQQSVKGGGPPGAGQPMQMGPGGQAGGGMGGLMPGQMMPPGAMQPPGGPPGGPGGFPGPPTGPPGMEGAMPPDMGGGAPNPDELRRMIGAAPGVTG